MQHQQPKNKNTSTWFDYIMVRLFMTMHKCACCLLQCALRMMALMINLIFCWMFRQRSIMNVNFIVYWNDFYCPNSLTLSTFCAHKMVLIILPQKYHLQFIINITLPKIIFHYLQINQKYNNNLKHCKLSIKLDANKSIWVRYSPHYHKFQHAHSSSIYMLYLRVYY
jgi:hypothetical protein